MKSNPFSLEGKKILITGASSGIGFAVAKLASEMGAVCVINGRNESRLNATLNELEGSGHLKIQAELTEKNCKLLVDDAVAAVGQLSGFVHCAGIEKTLPFRVTELSDLREIMSINLEAYWLLTQELLKRKKHVAYDLSIVAISSVTANGAAGETAYSASKGALVSLVKSQAAEYADRKIRFNCISPGYVDTPMLLAAKKLYQTEEDFDKAIQKRHPLGIGRPYDVAAAAVYLLSDASQWVTGTVLTVDGGYGISK